MREDGQVGHRRRGPGAGRQELLVEQGGSERAWIVMAGAAGPAPQEPKNIYERPH